MDGRQLIVTTTDDTIADDGQLSLREAIILANEDVAHDTIVFDLPSGAAIVVTGVLPEITESLTINGNVGGENIVLNGDEQFGLFQVSNGDFTLQNLVLTNTDGAAAVETENGGEGTDINVTIQDSQFLANNGGGTSGGLSISFPANSLVVERSTFDSNVSETGFGGAISVGSLAVVSISDSTFDENSAGASGGAISLFFVDDLDIVNSTFFSNQATQIGGAIFTSNVNDGQIANSTFVRNSLPDGIGEGAVIAAIEQSTIEVFNSIILDNPGDDDFDTSSATITVNDASLVTGEASFEEVFGAGATLRDNGGPVPTLALLLDPNNPALDASDDAEAPPRDARGLDRVDLGEVDNGGSADLGAFELNQLAPPNQPPSISLEILVDTLSEDTDTSQPITLANIIIEDDDAGTNSLRLRGPDTGLVELNEDTLELSLRADAELDFDRFAEDPTFTVFIDVDDPEVGDTPDDTVEYVLTVTDANDPPEIEVEQLVSAFNENEPAEVDQKVAEVTVIDDALGSQSLSLFGPSADLFTLQGTDVFLRAGTTFDFETAPPIQITIEVDDPTIGESPDDAVDLQFTIIDQNDAPSLIILPTNNPVPETPFLAGLVKVADIVISDDALGDETLALVGENARLFELRQNELFLRSGQALDFETQVPFEVTVTLDDPTLGAVGEVEDSAVVAANITDVNEPPSLALINVVTALPENTDTSSPVRIADIVVTDDALGENTLALIGPDAARFDIVDSSLVLRVGEVLNFEDTAALEVTVTLDDPAFAGLEGQETVNLDILDVDEPPVVTLENIIAEIAEDADTSTPIKIADITVLDDALGVNILGLAGADADLFEISGQALFLAAGAALDFETNPFLDVTITVAASGGAPQAVADVNVTVTDVNEPPALDVVQVLPTLPEDADTSVPIIVADITVTDDALGSNELTLSGADADLFDIIGSDLVLKADVALDFETAPQLDVTVTLDDPALVGVEGTASVTLQILDVNELPTVALLNAVTSLPEDADTSEPIKVADIAITDDALGEANLGLAGAQAGLFEIVGTELFLQAGAALDFETTAQVEVTVTVDDPALGAAPDDTAGLAVEITDVNEAPTIALQQVITTLAEDNDTAVKVADIIVTDDALGTNTLSLTGDDAALFEIVGDAVFLRADVSLDFETQAQLDVTVQVEDAALGGVQDSEALTLDVTDVNDAPRVALINPVTSLAEDADTSQRLQVAEILVTDDTLGTPVLALSGAEADLFEIDGTALFLSAGTVLDFESDDLFEVAVTIDDPAVAPSPNDTAELALSILDVNEAPTAVDDTFTAEPFAPLFAFDPTANDLDPDGDALSIGTLSATGDGFAFAAPSGLGLLTEEGGIVLQNEDGTLSYAPRFDFIGTDSFLYEVVDADGATDTGTVIFNVSESSLSDRELEARSVAYLYEAAFDRFPDLPGVNFWIDAVFEELPEQSIELDVTDVAQFFLDSPEFETFIGGPEEDLSDEDYVGIIFQNILDREGDPAGVAFWVEQLANPDFDRADLLTAFALSPENQINAPEIRALTEVSPGEWDFI